MGQHAERTKQTERRNKRTQKSKQYRDQLTDVITTLELIEAINNNTEPNCPSPRYFYKTPKPDICQCTICYEDPTDHYRSIHVTRPTSNKNQITLKSDTSILQRQKEIKVNPTTNTPTHLYTTKTLQERQEEYDRARARIFARISSNNKTCRSQLDI